MSLNPFRQLARKPRAVERDAFELVLADGRVLVVQRFRDPRARRIKLSVDERGPRLTLPLRASLVSGERFSREHADWLASQVDRHAVDVPAAVDRLQTTALPLRSQMLPLRWQTGRHTRLQHDGEDADDRGTGLVISLPDRAGPSAIARALCDFYEGQARADIGRWLPAYQAGLPRPPRQFRFKQMSSQWGSLAPDGTVALDLSLVLARPSAFEYVLVHELCHLLQANHSPAFWSEVEARCPAWREDRDYLKSEGRRLKATLRALLGGQH
ncbi:M48 family metallopeptidase [Lysobacter sp. A378]